MHHARRAESNQAAIEVMTAWHANPDGPPTLMLNTLQRHIEGHPSGERLNGAAEVIMGLTYLCGSLLVLREFESGVPGEQTLQELALQVAQVEEFESDMGRDDR